MSRRGVVDAQAPPPPCACACSQDLIPLSALAARLNLSEKTLKRWRRLHGLPLIRLTAGGGAYASWSQVERWAHEHVRSPENKEN